MNEKTTTQKLVPAVERATEILDLVASSKRFLTISELARQTSAPKSSVHNLCATLVAMELLIRRPDQSYCLGPHVLRWSNAFDRQTDVAAEFASLWDQIEIHPEAVVCLGLPDKNEVVFIAARQSAGEQRLQIRPGMRLPMPHVAAGKAILSCWSDYEIQRAFADGFPDPATELSLPDVTALLAETRGTRTRGYAIEQGQLQAGVASLGAPVLNSLNRPMAAVMIGLPAELFAGGLRDELAAMIVDMTQRLSRRMGAELGIGVP